MIGRQRRSPYTIRLGPEPPVPFHVVSGARRPRKRNDREPCPCIRRFDRDFDLSTLVRDDKLVRVPSKRNGPLSRMRPGGASPALQAASQAPTLCLIVRPGPQQWRSETDAKKRGPRPHGTSSANNKLPSTNLPQQPGWQAVHELGMWTFIRHDDAHSLTVCIQYRRARHAALDIWRCVNSKCISECAKRTWSP